MVSLKTMKYNKYYNQKKVFKSKKIKKKIPSGAKIKRTGKNKYTVKRQGKNKKPYYVHVKL